MQGILALIKDKFEDGKDNNNLSSLCNRMRISLTNMDLKMLEFDFWNLMNYCVLTKMAFMLAVAVKRTQQRTYNFSLISD